VLCRIFPAQLVTPSSLPTLSSNASVEYSFRVSRSASTPGSLRLGVIISGDFFSPPARVPRVTAYMWLSFHAIQNIALKFTIDRRPDLWYVCVCYLEQTSLTRSFTSPLILYLSITYRLLNSLAPLFRIAILCFQQLAASFRKMPGWHTPFLSVSAPNSVFSASRRYPFPRFSLATQHSPRLSRQLRPPP